MQILHSNTVSNSNCNSVANIYSMSIYREKNIKELITTFKLNLMHHPQTGYN